MALRTPLSVTPHLYMGDSTGRPLDNGVVYFGQQDKDPEFYPINLFSDDALTKPLMQPVHTKGGYLYDKGDMVEPHAKEIIYSVKVLDSYGRKVFYKGAMMRNSWNDDVIEQINAALASTAEQSAQIATDVAKEIADKAVISSGFVTIDSFELGATITQRNEALRHTLDGKLYRWAGDLPKVVPASSTPTSAGGMGDNAWLEVSDVTLRQEIDVAGGVEKIKHAQVGVEVLSDLVAADWLKIGMVVSTKGYYTVDDGGGNDYEIVAAGTGTDDGGSYINLSGSGLQAKGLFKDGVFLEQFGDTSGDCTPLFSAALTYLSGEQLTLISGKRYRLGSRLAYSGDVTIVCSGRAEIYQEGQSFSGIWLEGKDPVLTTTLSAAKEIGERFWRVSSSAGVEPGMLMEVKSSESWYYDPRPEASDARKSELHRVESINGNIITTELEANDGYPVSETVEVTFYNPKRVILRNIDITCDLVTDGSPVFRGLMIEDGADCELDNIRVKNYGLTAVNPRRCYNSYLKGGELSGTNGEGVSYSIQTWGCTLFDIEKTKFKGNLAGVDFSGMNIISLMCSIKNSDLEGGGVNSNGTAMGWGENGVSGAPQRGHGSHGPSDRCIFHNNRISGVTRGFVCRGRNHVISANVIESRTEGGAIRIYDGYNFTIEGNVCDRSFFGEKDGSTYAGANINARLVDDFVRIFTTYITDADGPLTIKNNKVQVQNNVVNFVEGPQTSSFVVVYENNDVRFRPTNTSEEVFIFGSDYSQRLNPRSSISVGNPRAHSSSTTVSLLADTIDVTLGTCIYDYTLSGSQFLEIAGGIGQTGATVNNATITFHGSYATVTFSIVGFSITASDGSNYSIRVRPYLYGASGGSSGLVQGSCGSVSSSGTVGHFVSSEEGQVIQCTLRSTSNNTTSVTGTATYPIG